MIDLHVHSNLSDGTNTLDELISIAVENKVNEFSLTDHDTVLGVEKIITKGKKQNINIIPGIEVSSVSNGHSIHILGYLIDYKNQQLLDFIKISNAYTKKYSLDMITKLKKSGLIDYKAERVEELKSFKNSIYLSDLIKSMIKDGYPLKLKDWPNFYSETFGKFAFTYLDNFPYSAEEAVEIILVAKGIPSFAHAARIGNDDIKEMKKLIKSGLGAVEVSYPYHDEKLIKKYSEFCDEYDLVKTGGTDWHGEFTTWNSILGQYGITDSSLLYEFLKKK